VPGGELRAGAPMVDGRGVDGVGAVVRGLRMRQAEIEEAIFARVSGVVSDPATSRRDLIIGDAEYVAGLRATVAAAVDYVLSGIERGEGWGSVSIPPQAAAQAHRAARNGVSLDTVMRRYMVGQALLWDYILEEADRVDWNPAHPAQPEGGRVREMLRAQASLVDRLVSDVAREHMGELERARRSRRHRLLERVKALLAGEDEHAGHSSGAAAQAGLDPELGYDLSAEHIGVIARGEGARELLREVADGLDRRLLSVDNSQGTVWAWLGGRRLLQMSDLKVALSEKGRRAREREQEVLSGDLRIAVGEPAWGIEGWRLTHRQAQAALIVALRRPSALTCYRDVALLASALKDRALAEALIDIYISPLEHGRGGGRVLRETLRAYLSAECNVSSAAKATKVARSTVIKRLRAIEERLGRTLSPPAAELEVALALDELGVGMDTDNPISGAGPSPFV
jgi:hypothetical protein